MHVCMFEDLEEEEYTGTVDGFSSVARILQDCCVLSESKRFSLEPSFFNDLWEQCQSSYSRKQDSQGKKALRSVQVRACPD